jgi:RimJ/RimL family protein N-acetyltransferase
MFARVLEVSDYPRGRLRLIRPQLEFASLSLAWLSDPEVGRYMGADFSGVTLETERSRIQTMLDSGDSYAWEIELDGRVIGAIEINRIKQTTERYGIKAANFSTLIGDKSQWGMRIAPSAKRAVLGWAFGSAGFELFVGRALSVNIRSWHSLEHLGFQFETVTPDMIGGKPVQWRVYTMTKAHWQDLQSSPDLPAST